MQSHVLWSAFAVVVVAFVLGCGSAPVDASGDIPAKAPESDAAPMIEPDGSSCAPVADGGPSSWSSLYRDYFGASGAATCTSAPCHGTDTGMGYISTHFLCPACDPVACYGSLTSQATLPVFLASAQPFEQTNLYAFLRHVAPDGSTAGIMPLDSPFTFQATDIQRISDWVAAGKKDD